MADTTLGATAAAVEINARLDSAVQAATRSMAEFNALTQLQQQYAQKSTVLQSALNGVLQSSISLADTMVQKLAGTLAVVQAALEQAQSSAEDARRDGRTPGEVASDATARNLDRLSTDGERRSGFLADARRSARGTYLNIAKPEKTGAKKDQKEDDSRKIKTGMKGIENGFQDAFEAYTAKAQDAATNTQTVFTKAFDAAGTALYNFVTTGKSNHHELTKALIADLKKIAIQQAIVWGVKMLFGGSVGPVQKESIPISGFAKGGTFRSPGLSVYSGGVYDTPQLFAFAKGAGVFGEAGPEAIMPLQRGPDGRLGVAAHGGGGSGGGVGVSIRIDNNGGKEVTTNESMLQQFGNEIGQFVERKYRELQSRDLKAGGVLSRSAM